MSRPDGIIVAQQNTDSMSGKDENHERGILQRIPQRTNIEGQEDTLGAAADHARAVQRAVQETKPELPATRTPIDLEGEQRDQVAKIKNAEMLALEEQYGSRPSAAFASMWVQNGKQSGAEHKVIISGDKKTIRKASNGQLNFTWGEYLQRLQIHNYLFPNTTYAFRGLMNIDGEQHIIVDQPYVSTTEIATREEIRADLERRGFKRQVRPMYVGKVTQVTELASMYVNEKLGVILWDVGSKNVITKDGVFFYIDPMIELVQ